MPTPPTEVVAGYRLLRRLGQGSHGTVFLAQSGPLDLPVALKVVALAGGPAASAAFLRSAQTAQRLSHPDIVKLLAAGVERGCGWLAMEALPGTDLTRYTTASRLLPEPVLLRVAERVARALAHAHRNGIVHRDVKPANILVHWPSDSVKLVDLGLARADDGLQTGTGIVPGTPAYMPPEQLAGATPTPRSDLYALGSTLYQLLTGHLPHEGRSMGELLRLVTETPAPRLQHWRPELPPALDALLQRLLAKRAADRPTDAEAVARELRDLALAWPDRP